jgi:hypothetical protein
MVVLVIVTAKEVVADVDPARDPCIVKVKLPVVVKVDQS